MMKDMTIERGFALLFGVTYLAVGVAGFVVTGFDDFAVNTDEALLIFEVNPFHNIVHLGVGALWIAASRAVPRVATLGITVGIGLVYLLATVLGFAGELGALSIDGFWAPDNFLHLGTAVLALVFGRAHDVLLREQAVT